MLPEIPQTVIAQLGAQAMEIEVTPLNVVGSDFRSKKLVQPSPDLLLIKLSAGARLFFLAFVGLGSVAVMVGMAVLFGLIKDIKGASPTPFGLGFAGIGLVFVLIGLGLFFWSKPFGFDRKRGILTDGKKTWRLTEILAVQLLFGGRHSADRGSYATYQLNLIFKDAKQDRLNLSNHSDLEWTRKTATQLAEFLKVPLLDQIEPKK